MTPTLSQIQNWDVEHLRQASTFWRNTAEGWDCAFARVDREMRSPGGTTWIGSAADTAQVRATVDLQKVRELARELRAAAAVATISATDLAAAKKAALSSVGEALAEGFEVNEDLSVEDLKTASMFPAEFYARQAVAESLAAEIRQHASPSWRLTPMWRATSWR